MTPVLRALVIYGLLVAVFRLTGKRTLAQITTFHLILLLIVSEAVQNGLVGGDQSITSAFVLVVTLVGTDVALSFLKRRSTRLAQWLEGVPLVIVAHGRPLEDRMARARVDVDDVLAAARERHGLERMDQIKYAVLERSGGISIVPRRDDAPPPHRGPAAARA